MLERKVCIIGPVTHKSATVRRAAARMKKDLLWLVCFMTITCRRNKWHFWYHSTLERSCKLPVFFVDCEKSLCYNGKLIDYGDFLSLLEE